MNDISNEPKPEVAMATPVTAAMTGSGLAPWWIVRWGRGRLGGSTFLDFVIQYGRHHGRRVKPLDGDLRSATLSALYPSLDDDGRPIVDGASSPVSEDMPAMLGWLGGELDASVGDRVCRALDFGGGDRVLQEYGRDVKLGEFCQTFSLGLICAFLLGPDTEDLSHALQIVRSGVVRGAKILIVLNEGVIRQGQSTEGVFDRTMTDPEMLDLLNNGAEVIKMKRLTCIDAMRARGLGYYEAAAGMPDREGVRTPPTMQHMVGVWLKGMEEQIERSEARRWFL